MENHAVEQPGTVNLSTTLEPGAVSLEAVGAGRPSLTEPADKTEAGSEKDQSIRDVLAAESKRVKEETAKEAAAKASKAADDKKSDKAEEKPAKARDDGGKFAKTDADEKAEPVKAKGAPEKAADASQSEGRASRYEAPARFNDQAKAEWESAPESVKAEAHRAFRELEAGLTKNKEVVDRYEKFRPFDEVAKSNGRELHESIAKVVEFERVMKENPLAAINFALREAGPRGPDGKPITIDDIVSHVAGQSNDQRLHAAHARIQELEGQIEAREAAARIPTMLQEFAKDHPRLDELADVITPLIEAGHPLPTAYKLAVALKPEPTGNAASEATTSQPLTQAQSDRAHTSTPAKPLNPEAASKSVRGSPANGDDEDVDDPDLDIREMLRREMRAMSR